MVPTPPVPPSDRCGRTSWWPCDAAEHDRELHVELGEEFGPLGPYTMRVLKDLAQQQRSAVVRSGFRVLRTKTFAPDTDAVRVVIERAAEIGALDDLQIDGDGRRFTARISGWEADSARGREAIRKADRRRDVSHPDGTNAELSQKNGTSDPVVPSERDMSGSVPLNRDKQSTTGGDTSAAVVTSEAAAAAYPTLADVMAVGAEAGLHPDDASVLRVLCAYPSGDHRQAANLAAADMLSGRRTTRHFHVVLGDKLADQAKAPTVIDRRSERERREADDVAALRALREAQA